MDTGPVIVVEDLVMRFGDNVIEFTYVIKEQVGTRFSGETEGKFTETIIGALKLYLDFVNLFLYILRIVNNR